MERQTGRPEGSRAGNENRPAEQRSGPEWTDPQPTPRTDTMTTPQPPHTCRCGARWSALGACHCSGCHRTFTALTPFDRHRRGDQCLDPATLGLIEHQRSGYTAWGAPGGRYDDDQ
ncbi:hypothetical protein SEA_AFFECA_55 [Gordonia phage Affeca]|nr:hypothetical protein SEA_AFFECA_55 [Gordonia phage Affeca]